jgi:chromosome transmission fidelity protein 18
MTQAYPSEFDDGDDELERELLAMHEQPPEVDTRSKRTLESVFSPPSDAKKSRSARDDRDAEQQQQQQQQHFGVSVRPRPDGDSMVLCGSGRRFFIGVREETSSDAVSAYEARRTGVHSHLGLLETPIADLLKNIDTKARWKRQQAELAAASDAANNSTASSASTVVVESALWVEKYAPKTFAELLSDEQVNRRALQWLKSWDPVVFPDKPGVKRVVAADKRTGKNNSAATANVPLSDINVEADAEPTEAPAGGDENDDGGGGGAMAASSKPASTVEDDRPFYKIMLLSGPPGVAKTTLAHILAVHCGYEPHEINASDDRSAKHFSERLQDVVQARRSLVSNLPPLLILDEIDGSIGSDGRGAIGELLKVVRGYKTKNGFVALRRPIICICNDKFAPPLRDLRPLCLQLDLDAPRTARLVRRLSHVSLQQGLSCDDSILSSLVESTRGDIRQSLTALQWAARAVMSTVGDSGLRRVRLQHLALADSSKDFTTSLFDAWRALATARSAANKSHATAGVVDVLKRTTHEQLRARSDFDELFDLLSSHSDDARLLGGVHEQLLSWRYTDPHLERTASALEWLAFAVDAGDIGESMSFGLRKYATCALLAVRQQCAVATPPRLVYPVGDTNLRQTRTRHHNASATFALEYVNAMAIVRAQAPDTGELVRARAAILPMPSQAVTCVATDMASWLAEILAPRVRAVNRQLLRPAELQALARAAAVHVALGLKYSQQSRQVLLASGSMNELQLDPPVTQLAFFDGDDSHHQPPDEVIRLLQHDIFKERMRAKEIAQKLDAVVDDASAAAATGDAATASAVPSKNYVSAYAKQMAALSSSSSGGGGAKSEPKIVKRDFFGRVVQPKAGELSKDDAESQKAQLFPVVFTFHEGFTNAVRRPVPIEEFAVAPATAASANKKRR